MAQKFGRGEVSDQATFGGFYTVLDEQGHALGAGYDTSGTCSRRIPNPASRSPTSNSITDRLAAYMSEVALVVPSVRYVGWDVVMGPDGPVLVEGNWGAGVFENKPTATGVRHGHLPRYRAAMGF